MSNTTRIVNIVISSLIWCMFYWAVDLQQIWERTLHKYIYTGALSLDIVHIDHHWLSWCKGDNPKYEFYTLSYVCLQITYYCNFVMPPVGPWLANKRLYCIVLYCIVNQVSRLSMRSAPFAKKSGCLHICLHNEVRFLSNI